MIAVYAVATEDQSLPSHYRIATDVGGTFTDLVSHEIDDAGVLRNSIVTKVHTTPPNFEEGVFNAVQRADLSLDKARFFAHGSTVIINALTERKGARTGLIGTAGFRDILEIGRGERPDFFNLRFKKNKPFVPRHLRKEIVGRINHRGEIHTPLDTTNLSEIVCYFKAEQVEAIAIAFLHAYANPVHELAVAKEVESLWPEVSVVTSNQVIRKWREYERTNTTVLSAYVQPVASRYLKSLELGLVDRGLGPKPLIMQSNGGIDTVESARAKPITLVESGPASGVLAAAALGRLIGEPNIIAFDVGGTTAKCSLIEAGKTRITTKYTIERDAKNSGYPIMTPVVDLVEIGSGGGSIAWVDEDNKLHVGPRSAGAVPGPAAYGQGGAEPTITDANLLTHRINPNYFMGGEQTADMSAARCAFEPIAAQLKISVQEAARGVLRIADNNMMNALKLVSVNRGYDPRDFTMIAFGGGGALHAARLAQELSIPKVIIPINSSVFSAWGMLMSDLRRDYFFTRLSGLDEQAINQINTVVRDLEQQALSEFMREGVGAESVYFERFCELRYQGQEHTVSTQLPDGNIESAQLDSILDRFHQNYKREYSYTLDNDVQLVGYHLVAFGRIERPELARLPSGDTNPDLALKELRDVDFDFLGTHRANIYDRDRLVPGTSITGPAIIEEAGGTVVLLPDQVLEVDGFGNLIINTNL